MSDVFKGIDMKMFPKSKDNDIRFIIAVLYSIFVMLAFFEVLVFKATSSVVGNL